MPQNKKIDQSDKAALHAAALRLAALHGWVDLTPGEVYTEARLPPPQYMMRDNKAIWSLVDDILASLDEQVHTLVAPSLSANWRDNLFELLMTRFDLMQPDRLAYVDIMPAALTRACAAGPLLTRRLLRAMDAVLTTAQVPLPKALRPLAVSTLTGIYLSLIETWRQDDSPDLAKTMAAVDKRIGWFEKILRETPGLNRQA